MGNHTALWEVCRDCRGLNKNSMGATWLKRNRKQQEIKHPLCPQPFSAWHLLAKKKLLLETTFTEVQIHLRLEIIPAIMKSTKQNCKNL